MGRPQGPGPLHPRDAPEPHLRRDAQCLAGDPHSGHKTPACVDSGEHAVASLSPPAPRVSEGTGTTPTLCRQQKPAQRRGGTYPVHGDDGPLPVSVLQGLRVQLKARGRGYRKPWASEQRPGRAASPSPPLLHVQAESAAGLGRHLSPEAKRGPDRGPAREVLEPQSRSAPRPSLPAAQARLGDESTATPALHPAPPGTLASQGCSRPPWQPGGLGAVLLPNA